MRELLRYLVENETAGNSDRLRSFNIAIDVFGRDAEFDGNNDSIVRVEAARLRRMLAAYYAEHPESPLQISIPKGRYVPVYEARKDISYRPPHQPVGGPGIAVLPFNPTTSADDNRALAEGLTAELRFQLSRFAEFRVVDASSMSDTPAPQLLTQIANHLECQYLVKGRITSTSGGIRISVEAIDTLNAHVVWTQRMEVKENDTSLLETEEQIATSIARALAPVPGSLIVNGFERGDRAPQDWDAIDCVFRWHYYRVHSRSKETYDALVTALKNLLEKHANFSLGWAMLGYMTIDAWIFRMQPGSCFENLARSARVYAGRALTLAPRNSPAHYVLGLCDYFGGNYQGFRQHFLDALQLNPNSLDLLHNGGALLAFGGNWREGCNCVADADLSYSNSMGLRFFYVVEALRNGDIEKANELLSVVEPHGGWYWCSLLRAVIAEQRDQPEEASASLNSAFTMCEELANPSPNQLEIEVKKWFGDPKIQDLLINSFRRIRQASY